MDYFLELLKAEDPQAYKKIAEQGILLGHPVTINGQTHRPDNGIAYHSTIKMFDHTKDPLAQAHEAAKGLHYPAIDPKKTHIEPAVLKDRFGNDTYAIKLLGEHQKHFVENRKKLSQYGYPGHSPDHPVHITVDKKTFDNVFAKKPKTAHEAGIEFGPAQLRHGHKVIDTFHPPKQHEEYEKLAASEQDLGDPLEKGALKNLGTALGAAAAVAVGTPGQSMAPVNNDIAHQQTIPAYSSQKMLHTIAQVESSNGKQMDHHALGGMHHGEKAYGKYGLTPAIIRDTVGLSADLKAKHKKALMLHGQDLHHYMQDHPELEDQVASRHLARLEHHFGHDPSAIGYAWLEGIKGTYRAQKEHKNISHHWHVKKINDAYNKGK
jgi:hypothetical protein